MLRTGKQYIAAIKGKAEVYVGGERIDDVTTHPAFRNAIGTVAQLYNVTSDPANRENVTYEEPETGQDAK